jgi:RNA polymerase sigma factor (sigma-70 family)
MSRLGPNLFSEAYGADPDDGELVRSARQGDGGALDRLVRRHQSWIYNLALRMLWDARDAEDATQEILVRMVTGLSSFRGESAFRTWAYRVAANHLLTWRKGRTEQVVGSFECYGRALEETPDDASADPEHDPELRTLVEEAKIGCTTGMLLCLDRQQRLVFVLTEIFEVSDTVGAEVLEMSRENFRQVLSRARRQLYGFMQGRCGLADLANPCRCARKTRGFIRAGIVDPQRLQFTGPALSRVAEVAPRLSRTLDAWARSGYAEIFRDHPYQESPDLAANLRALIQDHRLSAMLDAGRTE